MKKLLTTFMLAILMTTGSMSTQVEAAPKKVKVTYVENGGKAVEDQSVDKNTNPKEPKITKSGYAFKGWYTDKNLTKKWNTKSSKVTKNTKLYAKWAKTYKVTYVENGGKTVKDQNVTKNTNPTEPKATRSGYKLSGWYTDKNLTKKWDTKNGKITKNTTLYAKWAKTYKVTYVENGGKAVKDQYVTKNTNPKEPTITRSGYTFVGWYTDKSLTKKWNTSSSKITKATTLYAKWKSNSSQSTKPEEEVVAIVNAERKKAGLSPLKLDSGLTKVAYLKSKDMADKGYFDHYSPTYGWPYEMMDKYNISYSYTGENIAWGYKTPATVMEGWMNSPGHRQNILTKQYNKIGVGIYKKDGVIYWTQMFTD